MSELYPIDNLSENDSYIIRNQFTNENNGFYAENIIPNQLNNYSSSLKETKDQITLIDQNLIGNKRQTTDNIELINVNGIKEIESDNNKVRSNEKDSDNDACEQKTKKNRK